MKFYVIYTIDSSSKDRLNYFKPSDSYRRKLRKTEGNEQAGNWVSDWKYHAKYCGLLTKEQFKDLLIDGSLCFEDVETMGSLTLEYGWLPALSYRDDGLYDTITGCYVTPMPDVPDRCSKIGLTNEELEEYPEEFRELLQADINHLYDRDWERIKNAMPKY